MLDDLGGFHFSVKTDRLLEEGQVHYLHSGDGIPLVLLHQTSDAASMWEPVLPKLGDLGYRAVAIDIPGHGASFKPDFEPDGPAFARWVSTAVEALGIDRCHLLGHHFGATVAMWVAAAHPQLVASVLLYGLPDIEPEWRATMAAAVPRVFGADGEIVRHHWVRRWEMSGMLLPEGESSRFTELMGVRTMISLLQAGPDWCHAYHTMAGTEHAELAGRVECPVLLFAGPRDHMYRESEAAVDYFPDARFEHMDWVGVDVADEEPDKFCDVIHAFTRGVDGS